MEPVAHPEPLHAPAPPRFPVVDSNHDCHIQSVESCHWTNGEEMGTSGDGRAQAPEKCSEELQQS